MTVRIAPAAAFAAAAITTVASAQLSGQPARPAPLTAGASASSLAVVLPGDVLAAEGNLGEGTSLGGLSNTAQVVYSAEMMEAAGIRRGDRLTSLSYRLDAFDAPPVWSVTDYQIRLATSASPPEALDPDFTVNRGADYTVVRSGALSYDGNEYPLHGGPYAGFGLPIEFDSAFTYVGGDLLLEYTHTIVSGGGASADAESVAAAEGNAQFAPGFDGTVAGFGGPQGAVTVVRFGIDREATGGCQLAGDCFVTTSADCAAAGGVYLGDGAGCSGVSNDDICNAKPVGEGNIDFDTTEATRSPFDLPIGCDEGFGVLVSRDIWFVHTPVENGTLTISTCGQADYDTRLAAYTGACDAPVLLGCNDDGPGCGLTSELVVEVQEGVDVLIRVGGYAEADLEFFGVGTLTVTLAPCPFDVDGSGTVDFQDLLGLLGAFGACP